VDIGGCRFYKSALVQRSVHCSGAIACDRSSHVISSSIKGLVAAVLRLQALGLGRTDSGDVPAEFNRLEAVNKIVADYLYSVSLVGLAFLETLTSNTDALALQRMKGKIAMSVLL
jgi:hypothetical protein